MNLLVLILTMNLNMVCVLNNSFLNNQRAVSMKTNKYKQYFQIELIFELNFF